jgi:2-polyprenyl-3-methyl-5-hydroxy-6-metoxy-1,4-benzoquinol methylase
MTDPTAAMRVAGFSELQKQVADVTSSVADLLSAFQRVDRDLVSMGEQFAAGFGRLDSDVVSGLAAQVSALHSVTEGLRPSIEQLAAGFGRLDENVGAGFAAQGGAFMAAADRLQVSIDQVKAGFARLDSDVIAGFAEHASAFGSAIAGLRPSIEQLAAGFARLDRDVISGMGRHVEAFGEISERLSPSINQLVAAFNRLDQNVGTGFAGQAEAFTATTGQLYETLTQLVHAFGRVDAGQNTGFADLVTALARIEATQVDQVGSMIQTIQKLSDRLDRMSLAGLSDLPAPEGGSRQVDFRQEATRRSPKFAEHVRAVTERVVALSRDTDFSPLERRSPGSRNFDWPNYLRLSELRVVRALDLLDQRGANGRALDLGSYFGNTSLALAGAGWTVTSVDSYAAYEHTFDRHVDFLQSAGVEVKDFANVGFDLKKLKAGSFDAALCLGVIEHVPHTPRLLLQALHRVLKPGGWLVLDTPNLAYEYQRQKLARGESVFLPIETQFDTEIPFEGHHREYTPREVKWMLTRLGYVDIDIEMFNYSIYGLATLSGIDLVLFDRMERDPERRELIMSISRKPLLRA